LHSLIPGYQHTKMTQNMSNPNSPNLRTIYKSYENLLAQSNQTSQANMPIYQSGGSLTNLQPQASTQTLKPYDGSSHNYHNTNKAYQTLNVETGDADFLSPGPQVVSKETSKIPGASNNIFSPGYPTHKHNPLLNPMPYNMQNPYILKELGKISSTNNSPAVGNGNGPNQNQDYGRNRNYLGSIANNNLMKY